MSVDEHHLQSTGWTKNCTMKYFRNISEQKKEINKQCETHRIVQIHSETVCNVSSLPLDDTFQPVTPLIDGAVSDSSTHFVMTVRTTYPSSLKFLWLILSCSITVAEYAICLISNRSGRVNWIK